MSRVLFSEAARADLDGALAWYDEHAPQVVTLFRAALRLVVRRIAENPRQFASSFHGTRRALLRWFPYLVIFRETDEAAIVVALFHTSRDPKTWRQRPNG